MNYYVKGDAANAGKIKAAFEKLGIDVLDFGFADKTLVYCSIGGCVQSLPYSINLMHILYSHPDYQELELTVKPKLKAGDWLVTDYGKVSQVVSVDNSGDGYTLDDGVYFSGSWCDMYHPWSIADAKDGDVLVSGIDNPFIYNGNIEFSSAGAYVGVSRNGRIRLDMFPSKAWTSIKDVKPATIEQRHLLFSKIREVGYQWDAEKKELRKVQSHYDIKNFHAGMPVLVRADNNCRWDYSIFSRITGNEDWKFAVCNGVNVAQCIPFEGNEHLLGTTDMCAEEFINWII